MSSGQSKPLSYYQGWMKTADEFPSSSGDKVKVKRTDGTTGYSVKRFAYSPPPGIATQYYWEDLNGTLHDWEYYPEWAYMRKQGGRV